MSWHPRGVEAIRKPMSALFSFISMTEGRHSETSNVDAKNSQRRRVSESLAKIALDLVWRIQVELLESFHRNRNTAFSGIASQSLEGIRDAIVTVLALHSVTLRPVGRTVLIVLGSWFVFSHCEDYGMRVCGRTQIDTENPEERNRQRKAKTKNTPSSLID